MPYCTKCGHAYLSGSRQNFCSKCGNKHNPVDNGGKEVSEGSSSVCKHKVVDSAPKAKPKAKDGTKTMFLVGRPLMVSPGHQSNCHEDPQAEEASFARLLIQDSATAVVGGWIG